MRHSKLAQNGLAHSTGNIGNVGTLGKLLTNSDLQKTSQKSQGRGSGDRANHGPA